MNLNNLKSDRGFMIFGKNTMNKAHQLLTFILTLIFLFSCSGQKSSPVSVKLNLSALLASGSISLNGGVLIVGHTLDDSESFTTAINTGSQDLVIDLKKGRWEFAAIGWNGTMPLTGEVRCAYSGVRDISTDSLNVDFNLSRSNCKSISTFNNVIEFSPNAYLELDAVSDLNQFKRIQVKSCLTVGSADCATVGGSYMDNGLTKSFRFVIPGNKRSFGSNSLLPSLVSACYQVDSLNSTYPRLPVGTGGDDFIEYNLQAFTSTDCSGDLLNYPFFERSAFMGLNGVSIKSSISTDANSTIIYIEHNPTTFNEYNSSSKAYFGFAKDGDLATFNNGSYHEIPISNYGKIKSISYPSATTITISGIGKTFQPYDEIFWYVNNETTTQGCGLDSDPKKRFTSGMFGLALVKSVTNNGTDTFLELEKGITTYRYEDNSIGVLETPTDAYLNTMCSIQVAKVFQYNNVIFPNIPNAFIKPSAFVSGIGGIVMFKVKNEINVTNIDQVITASGKGFDSAITIHTEDCVTQKKRCLKMGLGSSGLNGGGIIAIQANNLRYSHNADGTFYIKSNGDESATGENPKGGHVNTYINNIMAATNMLTINTSAKETGTGATMNGAYYVNYCNKDANTNLVEDYNGSPATWGPFTIKCF